MKFRTVILASVCSAFLAASAAHSGAAAATSENALVSQAYQALQSGDAETAVRAYSKAIESRALEAEVLANALLNRGLAYQRLNEHDFAIDDYTAALRIDAMSGKLRALALYNRGLSYQRLNRDSLAMEDFTSALFLDGQFSHAYFSRGTLLRDGGQYLFALADFDKALRFEYPDPARVYVAQSATFEKLNRLADARESLKKALEANPRYEPARKRLAVLEGEPEAVVAAEADTMQTATLSQAGAALPEATAPSPGLIGSEAQAADAGTPPKSVKQFTDRVPQATKVAAVAPPEEKILAVEEVPVEEAPAAERAETVEPTAAPPETEAQAEPQNDQPKITGWSVQLASASTEDAAWATWKKMKARNKALASKEPVVVRADLGSKGVFYRVRLVGFDTQSEASGECAKLKKRGVKCYISKAES